MKSLLNLFRTKPSTQPEQKMEILNETPTAAEPHMEQAVAPENLIEQMARDYFSRIAHISLVAVIEKSNSPWRT